MAINIRNTWGDAKEDISNAFQETREQINAVTISDVAEIGDTLRTLRTDLGANWLLCNGDSVSLYTYPALRDFDLPYGYKEVEGSLVHIERMICYEGTWVAVGGINNVATAWVSKTGGTTWETIQLSNGSRAYDVACYDGTWVAVGSGTVWVSTSPSEEWIEKPVTISSTGSAAVACDNGTWIVCAGITSKRGFTVYTTTNLFDSCQSTTVLSGSGEVGQISIKRLVCYNDTWVIVGRANQGTTTSSIPCMCTSTDSGQTWSINDSISSLGLSYLYDVAYYDGTWVAVCHKSRVCALVATDPAGTWELVGVGVVAYGEDKPSISCDNGTWYIGHRDSSRDYPALYTTTNPYGSWIANRVTTLKGYVAAISSYNGTVVGSIGNSYFFSSNLREIPAISSTYIKVMDNK